MRVATFLSVAAIAAAASIGPALAYGPAASGPSLSYLTGGPEAASPKAANQRTQVAYFLIRKINNYYVIVQMDKNGDVDCNKRNCNTTAKIGDFKGLIQIDCGENVCVQVGKPSSE
jgi:hypothetical protein